MTTFTIDWALAGQWTVGLIVIAILIGAIATNLKREGN